MSQSVRVLIVDDQPLARQSLKALFATSPCAGEIREAANGAEALRVAEEFQPDVILMDVLMPIMDGLETTKRVRRLWPAVRVIVLSMSSEFRQAALQAGAAAYLTKGDSPEQLLATFETVVLVGDKPAANVPPTIEESKNTKET